MVTLKQLTMDDLEQITNVFEKAIWQTANADYTTEQLRVWSAAGADPSRWFQMIQNDYTIGAFERVTLTGFGSLCGSNYLDMLYVSPDYQGSGIAGSIAKKLIDRAAEMGASQIHTNASQTAVPFFQSIGFELGERHVFALNGVEIFNYRMTLGYA